MSGRDVLSAEVAAAVDAWRPAGWSDADREDLDALSDRVWRWVAAAVPQNATAARRLLLPAAALAVWAQRSLGSAEAATVFAPGTIEHWTMVVCADRPATWRQTARWALRHVGRAAHPAGWPAAPRRFGQRGVPAPYEAGEEAAYRLAVSLGPRRSDAGRGWVVCGALGAGLSGPELAAAETADLHDVADLCTSPPSDTAVADAWLVRAQRRRPRWHPRHRRDPRKRQCRVRSG